MLNAARCFWSERTVSAAGHITWGGIRYRVIQPGLEGRRVTVVETRDGGLLFEHGDQIHVARCVEAPGPGPLPPRPDEGRAA